MSDQAPSEARIRRARGSGAVPFSPALAAAAAWLAAAAAFAATSGMLRERLVTLARHAFAGDGGADLLVGEAWRALAFGLLPLVAALAAALAIGLVQTRFLIAAPVGDGERRPRRGALDEGALLPLAVAAATVVALALALRRELPPVLATAGAPLLSSTARALIRVAIRAGMVLAAVGVADFLRRRVAWERALRPSRAEAERERREEQGDPRLRAERRRRHRAEAARG